MGCFQFLEKAFVSSACFAPDFLEYFRTPGGVGALLFSYFNMEYSAHETTPKSQDFHSSDQHGRPPTFGFTLKGKSMANTNP